jgi:hypothetical protein
MKSAQPNCPHTSPNEESCKSIARRANCGRRECLAVCTGQPKPRDQKEKKTPSPRESLGPRRPETWGCRGRIGGWRGSFRGCCAGRDRPHRAGAFERPNCFSQRRGPRFVAVTRRDGAKRRRQAASSGLPAAGRQGFAKGRRRREPKNPFQSPAEQPTAQPSCAKAR